MCVVNTLPVSLCVCVCVQTVIQHVCVKSEQQSRLYTLTVASFEQDSFYSLISVKTNPSNPNRGFHLYSSLLRLMSTTGSSVFIQTTHLSLHHLHEP